MWTKFLYFFRVYRSTGYYIRMLVEVSKDIVNFLFIAGLTIVAFAHTYFIYLKNNSEGSPFESMRDALVFAYLLPFGDYGIDSFGDYHTWISWIFFVLATLILVIILLNLLISIVSDTFADIKANYSTIMYKDMLHLINENKFLYVGDLSQYYSKKYLFLGVHVKATE